VGGGVRRQVGPTRPSVGVRTGDPERCGDSRASPLPMAQNSPVDERARGQRHPSERFAKLPDYPWLEFSDRIFRWSDRVSMNERVPFN